MNPRRGEVWWADLGEPRGSRPAKRRPVLIISSNTFNRSAIATVVAAILTSNVRRGQAPGNVLLGADEAGLPKDSVVNVSQLVTIDKVDLEQRVGEIRRTSLRAVDAGLRLSLGI